MSIASSGSESSPLLICGDCPGELEMQKGMPFVGAGGAELDRMLREAGLDRSQAFLTYLVRERPPKNDISHFIPLTKKAITSDCVALLGKMVRPVVVEGYTLLQQEIELCKPKVILALGGAALWGLTGKQGLKHWRGSLLHHESGIPVIATYQPSALWKQFSLRPIVVQDLRRVKNALEGRGLAPPKYEFIIKPSFPQVMETLEMLRSRVAEAPLPLSLDIETRKNHIICLGLAWTKTEALCIPLVCTEKGNAAWWCLDEEAEIVHTLYKILTHSNAYIIGQNSLFDFQYIFRCWHFVLKNGFDVMLGHHCCFTSMPKSLDFQASMYNQFFKQWKNSALFGKGEGKPDE